MVVRLLIKHPVLIAGVLMMSIYLMTYSGKYSLKSRAEKLIPVSCRAVRVKLDRRIPENWSSQCQKNTLIVDINFPDPKEGSLPDDKKRMVLFRELANSLVLIATHSPSDNLERTDRVFVKFHYRETTINALTLGKHLVKLQTMKDKKMIKNHLKLTVQIQEVSQH